MIRVVAWPCTRGATSSSIQGGQFSWNFIPWRHRDYSTVVQTVTDNVLFATFPKIRTFQF